MNLFFIDPTDGKELLLSRDESHHAIKVLRLGKGDSITLTDGEGYLYSGIISDPSPGGCTIEVTGKKSGEDNRNYNLHIALSPLKNSDRFEWFVEKAIEIGVDEITPLICHRTVKKGVKAERLEKIVKASMKQSLKSKMARINDPQHYRPFTEAPRKDKKVIAHCSGGHRTPLKEIVETGKDIVILVGPEGDFTSEEIEIACGYDFSPVTLGKSRLRSETAAIVACHTVSLINS